MKIKNSKIFRILLFVAVYCTAFGCASQSEVPTILAKKMYLSDLNRDGLVDAADAGILFSNFGKLSSIPQEGDLNGDGFIDEWDFEILLQAWSESDDKSKIAG